ncbi:MFS transporter [Rhodococcus sp. NCIMB 12038]|uniref:MFS transporter n=1 Tax=Rhodococcus sp. NCIMB 12038 TaxID=933800 RepID=UPI000B3D100C|nr:MFS transporter [Rhodococcus sp. NCIMB 12038]OUS92586.1 MFS transporter [Rhodococcus sp. NCIMB 12038]
MSPTISTPDASRRAALASFLGSAVEYYDFMIYGTASALVFSTVFFPDVDPVLGTLSSVATFGVGYVARPVGSIILGHFGDRVGRQKMLMFTIVLMGVATFLIGCLPGYDRIGALAPAALVLLRICQGLSAAGEQAGANAMTLEHAPEKKRALYTSWAMAGTQTGILLGTLMFIPIAALPDDALYSWGWRVPFLLSAALVLVTVWIRRNVPEPEIFTASKESGDIARFPVVSLVKNHWASMIRVMLCSLLAVIGTVMQVFGLAYATKTVGIPAGDMLTVTVVTSVVSVVTIPLWATVADRIGRKPVFVGGMLVAAVMIFGYFYALSTANIWFVFAAALLMNVGASGAGALQPALYTEMFEAKVRFSGVAVSTQFGVLLAGFAPAIGYAILGSGQWGWIPVAIFTAICCLVSAASAATARETKSVALHDLGSAQSPVLREAHAPLDHVNVTAGER